MPIVPLFSVDGEPDHELTAALASLKVEAMLHDRTTLFAEFAGGHALEVGTAIQIALGADAGRSIVFDGQVTAVEFVFEEDAAPSVVVSAAEPSRSQSAPSSAALVLVRGNELVSAHVRVQKARAFVTVTGATTGSPDIVLGSLLRLERIGASFSGDGYHVTKITHSFDLEHGLTSTFEAQRAL